MVGKRLAALSLVLALMIVLTLLISAAGDSTRRDTSSPNDTDPARTIGRTGNNSNNETCGNNICESGEANLPGGCGPNADPSCLGPPSYAGTCPQDCENNTNNSIWEKCGTFDNRTERIKCRLMNAERFANFSESDESCQGLRNRSLCVALYVRSQNCYKMDGERKDRCFMMVANFTQSQLAKEVNMSENKTHSREKVRHYMVLVLYNLQERVEKAVEKERLTVDEGAILVNKIVEIKRAILDGAAKTEIRTMLQELREIWRTYKADE
ncbi:hypothetical protein HYT23_01150 [Candidatus Pacearchaeota archaeon]|nr:hypothetical protein [Candidatus Pacearchaeota archaeon]